MRVLIIGCGYVGLPLGVKLLRQGHEVYGLRRSPGKDLEAAGIHPLSGDITRPHSLASVVTGFDWVINTVSSSKGGMDDYRAVYLEGNRNMLQALASSPPAKYVFTSSTSVYGQTDGSVVYESSPAEPASVTSRILVEAERLLTEAHTRNGFASVIVRPSGIYGPGRGYLFHQHLKGEARIIGNGERYINMIHVDDMVGGILAVLRHGAPGEIYNLSDDEPVTQRRFFEWLSQQLGKSMPPFITESDAPPRKRGVTNKRVSNAKLKEELGYRFSYPTFREGYQAAVAEARGRVS